MRTKIGIPERIDQKIFHAEIVVDNEKVATETANYKKIPTIVNFTDDNGKDIIAEQIQLNYDKIKADVQGIVENEIARIQSDPQLKHLIKK